MNEKEPSTLTLDEIEEIEKLTLRWIFQAILDFGMEAYEVFLKSPDSVKDIAEDITRELLDRLPGYNVPQRIYGTVDYKKARYIILPDQVVRQALFIGNRSPAPGYACRSELARDSFGLCPGWGLRCSPWDSRASSLLQDGFSALSMY